MGSYCLSSSLGHSSSNSLPSGLIGVDVGLLSHHARLSQQCLMWSSSPPLSHLCPTLKIIDMMIMGYFFFTYVGSGPVTLSVALDKVVNQILKAVTVPVSWGWWEDNMRQCMQRTYLYFYVVGYRQALTPPPPPSIHTRFCSCLFWASLTLSCFNFMPPFLPAVFLWNLSSQWPLISLNFYKDGGF